MAVLAQSENSVSEDINASFSRKAGLEKPATVGVTVQLSVERLEDLVESVIERCLAAAGMAPNVINQTLGVLEPGLVDLIGAEKEELNPIRVHLLGHVYQ